jgi:molecular chaperone Hsp33
MKSNIIRATAANNSIRAFVANTTHMIEEARKIHHASPVAIAALGRTLTVTSIMGLMLKGEDEKITVRINGGGPLGSIIVVGYASGNVKGYIENAQVEGTTIRPGKLNVGEAVGVDGSIKVIKDLGLFNPYTGTYPLVSGEIGEDFAAYFMHSEQQPSAVAVGVLIDVDYSVKAAGGFIIQVLPDIDAITLAKLEDKIKGMESITSLMSRGIKEEDLLNFVLDGMEPQINSRQEVDFICDCSRERLGKALLSVSKKDLEEMINEDGGAELICHFCNKKYFFDKAYLIQQLNAMYGE